MKIEIKITDNIEGYYTISQQYIAKTKAVSEGDYIIEIISGVIVPSNIIEMAEIVFSNGYHWQPSLYLLNTSLVTYGGGKYIYEGLYGYCKDLKPRVICTTHCPNLFKMS